MASFEENRRRQAERTGYLSIAGPGAKRSNASVATSWYCVFAIAGTAHVVARPSFDFVTFDRRGWPIVRASAARPRHRCGRAAGVLRAFGSTTISAPATRRSATFRPSSAPCRVRQDRIHCARPQSRLAVTRSAFSCRGVRIGGNADPATGSAMSSPGSFWRDRIGRANSWEYRRYNGARSSTSRWRSARCSFVRAATLSWKASAASARFRPVPEDEARDAARPPDRPRSAEHSWRLWATSTTPGLVHYGRPGKTAATGASVRRYVSIDLGRGV